MSEDVDSEVIKRTRDSLAKYIKKPPLTDKLLKKPPFRFLHDIINNVIRETGFLQGLMTEDELNHENIKDRESKVAFLQKVIDAVKIITGVNLTVRPTKIVAGHEATKTNEFLQAIGNALDNKLSSAEYVAQLPIKSKNYKTKPSFSKDDGSKSKSSSTSKLTTQVRGQSQDRNKTKDAPKKKSSNEPPKRSKNQADKKSEEELATSTSKTISEKKGEVEASTSVSKHKLPSSQKEKHKSESSLHEKRKSNQEKHKLESSEPETLQPESSQYQKHKSDLSSPEKHKSDSSPHEQSKSDAFSSQKQNSDSPQPEKSKTGSSGKHKSERLKSATIEKHRSELEPSTSIVEQQQQEVQQTTVQENTGQFSAKEPDIRPQTAHENRRKSARLKSAKVPKPENATVLKEKLIDGVSESIKAILGGQEPVILGIHDPSTPMIRPKSVRPKSARILHGRPKSRIEVVKADDTVEGEGKVKVIPENDPLQEQDEDDTFIVTEAPPVLLEDTPIAPLSTEAIQPEEDGLHGHLVAQILETQKELEDDAQRSLPHQDTQNKKVEIEWDDAGRQREREIVSKEVERLRSSIQTLTRTANPLGKLMDFLQEDIDTMQRELRSWRITNNDLRKQLLEEERKTELSIQPLKIRLAELNEKIELKLDEISAVKARIMEGEVCIRKNATPSFTVSAEFEESLRKIQQKYST